MFPIWLSFEEVIAVSDTEPLFSVGSTDPEALYDFAVLVSAAEGICIDSDSELFRMYRALVNSAWSQLPEVVTIDFREPPRASELSQ